MTTCDECGETRPTGFVDDELRCGYFCTACVPDARAMDPATSASVRADLDVHWDDSLQLAGNAVEPSKLYAVIVSVEDQVLMTANHIDNIGDEDPFRVKLRLYRTLGEVARRLAAANYGPCDECGAHVARGVSFLGRSLCADCWEHAEVVPL